MPAEPKNRLAVRHGAHAEVLPARVESLAAQLSASLPVNDTADAPAVKMLATALCRLEDVGTWLDTNGSLDRRGRPRSASLHERRLQSHALKLMVQLGMTPSSRAKLGLTVARIDLAQAMSEPDPVLRAQLMQQAGLDPGAGAQPPGEGAQE